MSVRRGPPYRNGWCTFSGRCGCRCTARRSNTRTGSRDGRTRDASSKIVAAEEKGRGGQAGIASSVVPLRCPAQSTTRKTRDRATPPTGGARRSDRSDVGCSHTEECPLFPLLSASLRGWRDHYCDSDDSWLDCARYKASLTGPVPISLLPNGRDAQHLKEAVAEPMQVLGAAEPVRAPGREPRMPRQQPRPPLDSWSREIADWFEPEAAPARPVEPSPRRPPRPAASPPRRAAHVAKRHWWTRIAEWMRSPA